MKEHQLKSCSKLLASLVMFDTQSLEAFKDKCLCLLEKNDLFGVSDEEKVLLNVLSTMGQNQGVVKSLIESRLPLKICSHIGRVLGILSRANSDDLYRYFLSLYTLLSYIYYSLTAVDFKEWIGSIDNLAFLQPLLEFLSTAYLDKCLVAEGNTNHDSVLGLIHKLQHITILMVKRMTSFNHQNQALFVRVVKKLLSSDTRPETSLFNNSFLKRLVLQLILEEETVIVQFQRGGEAENESECTAMDSFNINLKSVTRARLRLSDPLSSIFSDRKGPQSCPNEKPKKPPIVDEVESTYHFVESPEDADWGDNPNMSAILASAQSAAEKRQGKTESVSNDKAASDSVSYGIEYYLNRICKDSLPLELTIGQILYILEGNKLPCDSGLLTLYVQVKQIADGAQKSLKQLSMLQSDTYPTLLRVFAADGGIQLLAKHSKISLSGQFGQAISTSIGFLMRFVSLSGFSDIFLKESQKAEHLLRLMLGEEESSSGGKF